MEYTTKGDALPPTEDDEDEGPDNIWIASSNGDITRVQQLLDQGVDVNVQDDAGYSPMWVHYSFGACHWIE